MRIQVYCITLSSCNEFRTVRAGKQLFNSGDYRRQIQTVTVRDDLFIVGNSLTFIRSDLGNGERKFLMTQIHLLVIQVEVFIFVHLRQLECKPMTFPSLIFKFYGISQDTISRSRNIFYFNILIDIHCRFGMREVHQDIGQIPQCQLRIIGLLHPLRLDSLHGIINDSGRNLFLRDSVHLFFLHQTIQWNVSDFELMILFFQHLIPLIGFHSLSGHFGRQHDIDVFRILDRQFLGEFYIGIRIDVIQCNIGDDLFGDNLLNAFFCLRSYLIRIYFGFLQHRICYNIDFGFILRFLKLLFTVSSIY